MSTMALQRGSDSPDGVVQVGRDLLLAPARSIKLALFSSQHCPGPLALLERSFLLLIPSNLCISQVVPAAPGWYFSHPDPALAGSQVLDPSARSREG